MLSQKTNPSFICFTTDMKQDDGKGHVVAIVRIEDMELENEKIMVLKGIQEKMAEEIETLINR